MGQQGRAHHVSSDNTTVLYLLPDFSMNSKLFSVFHQLDVVHLPSYCDILFVSFDFSECVCLYVCVLVCVQLSSNLVLCCMPACLCVRGCISAFVCVCVCVLEWANSTACSRSLR